VKNLVKKKPNQNVVSYVIQEKVNMPVKLRRKMIWQYKFKVPNVGNDGKDYWMSYDFQVQEPSLTDFELERTKGIKVEPLIKLTTVQGAKWLISKYRETDFKASSLYGIIDNDAHVGLEMAIADVDSYINEMRKKLEVVYSTNMYNIRGDE